VCFPTLSSLPVVDPNSITMDDPSSVEKGGHPHLTDHDILSKEVYGIAVDPTETSSGEIVYIDKFTGEVVHPSKGSLWGMKVRKWINSVGAEETGIERIPESARIDQNPRDLFTLFMSANVGTATLAFGTLGPGLFYLGWWDSFLALLFFNLIGSLPCALMATCGPKLGLRTMVIPRYSFGWWPAKLIATLNLLNQIGWAMVNTIAGADILYDVGDEKLPASVAVLIIGLMALIIGLFGYKIVHHYERWSWIVMTVCFCILAGFGAKHFVNVPMGSGAAETSSILSFGTAIIGFQVNNPPADYTS
jgi:purine-cytosine permease-like protein